MSKKKIEDAVIEETNETTTDGIIVRDPLVLRPVELPLVIELPADANDAQKDYAKILNAYAYENPEKWAIKKDVLIARLVSLKTKNSKSKDNIKINESENSFVFTK